MKKALTTRNTAVERTNAEKVKYARRFIGRENTNNSPDYFLVSFVDYMDKRTKERKLTPSKITDEDMRMFKDANYLLGLDTHMPVADSVGYEYHNFITEMIERTVREYGCTTAIEISLAQNIALAHVRVLSLSKTLSTYGLGKVSVNDDINDFYRNVSKELDRAQRQMVSAIFTLKQLKAPQMSLNIKANTAFIANNQQINERQ
jgi:hypothetical protein